MQKFVSLQLMKNNQVIIAISDEEILKCSEVIFALRPLLISKNILEEIRKTLADNRTLIYIEQNGKAVSAAIFEEGYNLYRGSYIYIDDLTTLNQARGNGFASQLLDWIINYAKDKDIAQVHLDSGVSSERSDAHRLYLNKRFNITSLHFALKLK
jgi:GNAT superfamily N-acetyltransferase